MLKQSKNRHIPKEHPRFNRHRHCIEPWVNKKL